MISSLELTLFLAFAAAAALPFVATWRPHGSRERWLAVGICASSAVLAAWALSSRADDTESSAGPRVAAGDGYVSSGTCRTCHPGEHASWQRSYHRTMTQWASPATVRAPWHGELEAHGQRYELEQVGEELTVLLEDPDWARKHNAPRIGGRVVGLPPAPRVRRRAVLATGSHHMQTYWLESELGREVHHLPFVYLLEEEKWLPRREAFVTPPADEAHSSSWNTNCLKCHTTRGQPGRDWRSGVLQSRAVELGIACEACHGPGAEHVRAHRNPVRRYSAHLGSAPDATIVQPERLDAARSSQVCGQCHGITLYRDNAAWWDGGSSFRPGDDLEVERVVVERTDAPGQREQVWLAQNPGAYDERFWPDGMVRVTGREYNAMIQSPCYQGGRMSCLSCHSMHGYSDRADQLKPAGTDNACMSCHVDLRERIAEHSHHAVGSSGASCTACHMPRTAYGLLGAVASHQIDSPDARDTVAFGRPNACNLCHIDRSLGWAAEHLQDWFGIEPPAMDPEDVERAASLLWLLRGDAGLRALAAAALGSPEAVAVAGADWQAPFLAQAHLDPYGAVRLVAARSLQSLPGYEDVELDTTAPFAAREETWARIVARFRVVPRANAAELLLDDRGAVDVEVVRRLLGERDDRPVNLVE